MIKPLEKIREFFVGERFITEVCDKIVKSKKLPKSEKLNSILNAYSDYYNSGKFESDVKFATYENYYEYFMLDDGIHEYRYNKAKQISEQDTNYLISVVLTRQIEDIGVDISTCTPKQAEIVNSTKDLRKQLYTNNFDYGNFYFDETTREKVVDASQGLIKQLKDYSKQQQNDEVQTL